ncbi:MAG: AmmeMemoRadiSam system protein B [Nitrospirota bacterium]
MQLFSDLFTKGYGLWKNLISVRHKYFSILTTCFLLILLVSPACTEDIKEPSVAGTFYPADKDSLKETVEGFLSRAESSQREGKLIALISPHAGYSFSGQVSAYGYRQIRGKDIRTVILLGPSHHARFNGASVYSKGTFRTPFGSVKINERLAEDLLDERADVKFYPQAFEKEHSIEVQIPFLQTVLRDFTIVPILIGSPTSESFEHLILKLTEIFDEKTLLIASTDLSHYHDYQAATEMDKKIISAMERLSLADVGRLLRTGEAEMCGGFPAVIAMEVARRSGANMGILFKYANSGDITNDRNRVVGYASMGLYRNLYTEEEKKELLAMAKNAIREYVINGKVSELEMNNPKLKTDTAVFVTIKTNGSLRGCIGHIQPVMPLYQSVVKNAIAACSKDPRFPPIKQEELKEMDLEISILSPLKPLRDMKDIQIGKHGLYIVKGFQTGLLLPQVAVELGWDKEKFLEQVSLKAGLPGDAWKDSQLYTFSAEIIR